MKTSTLNSLEGLNGFPVTFSIFSFIEKNGKETKPFRTLQADDSKAIDFEPCQGAGDDSEVSILTPALPPPTTTQEQPAGTMAPNPAPEPVGSNPDKGVVNIEPPLPKWCRADCQRLDVIAGVGPGCTQTLSDGPWRHGWRHHATLSGCPKSKKSGGK